MSFSKAQSKSFISSDAPTFFAVSTNLWWRSVSVSLGCLLGWLGFLGIIYLKYRRKSVRYADRSPARGACPACLMHFPSAFCYRSGGLQDRFLASLVAITTYPMRWFGACAIFFEHVSEGSISNLTKGVSSLLAVPCLKASNFFFKSAYLLNQRRLRCIGLYCASLGGQDLSIEFDNLGRSLFVRTKRGPVFEDVRCLLERAERATDVCESLTERHRMFLTPKFGLRLAQSFHK